MEHKGRVLVVDDTPDNIFILRELLADDFTVLAACDGPEALSLARTAPQPDIILLDVLMPGMDGYEVCRRLKADALTQAIPVLFVTTLSEEQDESQGLELGAVDYIMKPVRPSIIQARVRNHMRLKEYQDRLEALVQERTLELAQTQDITLLSMAALAEMRDNELGGHFRRTREAARILATEMEHMPAYEEYFCTTPIETLVKSIPLHDVGKVGIPDAILLKPGPLTEAEFERMKHHAVYGRDILQRAEEYMDRPSFMSVAKDIAYTHHEKWEGSGYPQGLAGTDIPVCGRIMAIIDVYDAIISARIYKPPLPHSQALKIITKEKWSHFDPAIADIFLARSESIRAMSLEFADTEEERASLRQ